MFQLVFLLSLQSGPTEARVMPAPIDPKMPTVDRLAGRMRDDRKAMTSTELNVCVRPSGKVASVVLVGGSAFPELDLAMVKDASAWQFTTMPGPDTLQSCRVITVAYRAHE